MTNKRIVQALALTALLLQIVLLVYSLLFLKGKALEENFVIFLRIALLIGSGMMVILTRYFLRLSSLFKSLKNILFIQVLSMIPAIIIPVGGFIFAHRVGDGGEYLLFFFIGLYHLVRYYGPISKVGGVI
jgi:hypothetical protein